MDTQTRMPDVTRIRRELAAQILSDPSLPPIWRVDLAECLLASIDETDDD